MPWVTYPRTRRPWFGDPASAASSLPCCVQAVGGLQRVAKRCLVACGASRVDPAHQDPIDEIRVVAIRLLAHLDFDLVGDRAEGLGLLAARLDRFNELPATGELLAGRDLLWFVGHLAHLTDEAGRTREAYSPQDWGHRLLLRGRI